MGFMFFFVVNQSSFQLIRMGVLFEWVAGVVVSQSGIQYGIVIIICQVRGNEILGVVKLNQFNCLIVYIYKAGKLVGVRYKIQSFVVEFF